MSEEIAQQVLDEVRELRKDFNDHRVEVAQGLGERPTRDEMRNTVGIGLTLAGLVSGIIFSLVTFVM